MSKHAKYMAAVFALTIVLVADASATTWSGKMIGRLLMPDTRDCIFFEMVGVPEADANVPGGLAWVAVPRTQTGFKEIYALLLWAKASSMPLTIETTGLANTGGCGSAVGLWQIYTTS